ncbi:SulP family inorganic anion transporter [Streptomyces sp. CB03238]|uniref:SulP family inorganic anion transporter n=1 Tax=Streptomyces sp. CB03238 TaxID=1907777 RepID=UPI000A1200FE|nr:SulP family inorganic anion transporter [Streptomyces sp. CB03238]ORT57172.1 hypothetical protein BKD26_24740 [Streptomyces sp. CB03238]
MADAGDTYRRLADGQSSPSPPRQRARHARPTGRSTTPTSDPAPSPAPAPGLAAELRGVRIGTEVTASFVVFLVALPLCIGIAVASGAPPELGIVSGIVGGLVVGLMRGSALQVSGPAAGLAALVAEAVLKHGPAMLGIIVTVSGLLQIALAIIRLGRMFQAISDHHPRHLRYGTAGRRTDRPAAGTLLAVLRMSRTTVRRTSDGETAKLTIAGSATFVRLPQLLEALEALEALATAGTPRIRLDLTAMTHLDHACRTQIDEFVAQQRETGTVRVELLLPNGADTAGGGGGGPALDKDGDQEGDGFTWFTGTRG